MPHPRRTRLAAGVLASLDNAETVVVDGLVFGAIPDLLEREAARLRFVALIHLPLAADITAAGDTPRLAANERRALATARLVVVTSAATVPMLTLYELPARRITVVEPGTDRKPLHMAPVVDRCSSSRWRQCITERIRSAAASEFEVSSANWHLTCAGGEPRSQTVERIRVLIDSLGLQDHVSLVGELDDAALDRQLDAADVFVLATLQETYGMAVAEALARGLPVVATDTGAIPTLVGSEAGIVVPRGNVGELADALRRAFRWTPRCVLDSRQAPAVSVSSSRTGTRRPGAYIALTCECRWMMARWSNGSRSGRRRTRHRGQPISRVPSAKLRAATVWCTFSTSQPAPAPTFVISSLTLVSSNAGRPSIAAPAPRATDSASVGMGHEARPRGGPRIDALCDHRRRA